MRVRTPAIDRVLANIVRVPWSGCWIWDGSDRYDGYVVVNTGWRQTDYAHRIVYEALRGPIPGGMTIDHLCRVRCCCNPAHMEIVTIQENVARRNGGAACGHDASERRGDGRCKACRQEAQGRWREKQKT